MNVLKPFLSPKKLRKLQNNPQAFFKDALDKRIIPIQTQLKSFKPKKNHGFAEYYIISAVYNVEKYLDDYFNSILKQRLDFKNNITIICVDDGSADRSAEIIQNYQKRFPENIVYLHKENGGQASARNLGIKWLQEKLGCLEGANAEITTSSQGCGADERIHNSSNKPIWVTFTDPDDFLDRDYFYEVDKFLGENADKDICMVGCNATLFLEKEKAYKNHPLHHFIFIKEIVKVSDLNKEIKMPSSTFYQMLSLKVNKIYFNEKVNYFEDALFSLTYLDACRKNAYCGFLENAKYYLRKRESANSTQDKKTQDKRYYLDTLRFNILRALTMNQSFITQSSCFAALLYYVREIIEQDRVPLNSDEKLEFFELLRKSFSLIDNDVIVEFNALGNSPMYKMGILYCFKGEASFPQCVEIVKYDAIREEILLCYYTSSSENIENIIFDGQEYYADYEKIVRYDFLGEVFIYEKRLWVKLPSDAKELKVLISGRQVLIKYGGKSFQKLQLIWLFNKISLLKKNIADNDYWLFIDRDVEADDNAEYLYRYVREVNPSQKIYFALSKRSSDWDRLNQDKFELVELYSSHFFDIARKCKFFITSHTPQTYGIHLKEWQKFLCLGHGVDFVEISQWFNGLNISCRFSSIQREYDSIVRDGSRYKLSRKECALTGQARWDNLLKNNQINTRRILIMPTWRLYLTYRQDTLIREMNDDFLQSQYFIHWNSLLHSNRLKQLAETYHYSVLFCPHFNMMKMLDYFEIPEYIEVGYRKNNEPFQKIFQTSDLMITDYTSAASEMAYLKKPVLYYQFDEQEFFSNHSYRKGWFDYRKDGFGPVVTTEEELLKELEILLQNDCKVGEPYKSNIENTFEFRDGKCCERIYNVILELDKPYERKWTLDYVLNLARNALNAKCYKEASERFRFVLEHLRESEFGNTQVILDEEMIFNYLYASRLNQASQEALEFVKAQDYESKLVFSNKVKFEIIKNYIELANVQEVIARLEALRETIPVQDLLEFAYLKLRIYAYLGDKVKLKEVYNELKNTYNIDKKDLDLDLFLFQNELIKAASIQAAAASAGGGGFSMTFMDSMVSPASLIFNKFIFGRD